MKEYKINKYLSLRLEGEDTVIYVSGKRFNQCKALFLSIPRYDIEYFDEIESIDEVVQASKLVAGPFVKGDYLISPEVEFFGHCSNLQAWTENGYNTRLLHSNLSFPLLKKLMEAGDSDAKAMFKDEIAERFYSGNVNVMLYLLHDGYLAHFTKDEHNVLMDSIKFDQLKYFKITHLLLLLTELIKLNLGMSITARKMLKDKIFEIFRNSSYKVMNLIIKANVLKYLDQKEINLLLEQINVDILATTPIYAIQDFLLFAIKKGDLRVKTKFKQRFIQELKTGDCSGAIVLLQIFDTMDQEELTHFLERIIPSVDFTVARFVNKKRFIEIYDASFFLKQLFAITIQNTQPTDELREHLKLIFHTYNTGNVLINETIYDVMAFQVNFSHQKIRKIKDIHGLQYLTDVKAFSAHSNQITDIAGLEHLTNVTELVLSHNKISDLSVLQHLPKLKYLDLGFNKIADISPMVNLTELEHLDLSNNELSSIDGLENLTKLRFLNIEHNKIRKLGHREFFSKIPAFYF